MWQASVIKKAKHTHTHTHRDTHTHTPALALCSVCYHSANDCFLGLHVTSSGREGLHHFKDRPVVVILSPRLVGAAWWLGSVAAMQCR